MQQTNSCLKMDWMGCWCGSSIQYVISLYLRTIFDGLFIFTTFTKQLSIRSLCSLHTICKISNDFATSPLVCSALAAWFLWIFMQWFASGDMKVTVLLYDGIPSPFMRGCAMVQCTRSILIGCDFILLQPMTQKDECSILAGISSCPIRNGWPNLPIWMVSGHWYTPLRRFHHIFYLIRTIYHLSWWSPAAVLPECSCIIPNAFWVPFHIPHGQVTGSSAPQCIVTRNGTQSETPGAWEDVLRKHNFCWF